MKMIYAGQGVSEKPYTELLFNCTRNQRCERPFYVPVNLFSDISLYFDLPGSPTLTQIDVLNVCDIENVGSAVSTSYVVGQKPDGAWYGVFAGLVVTPPIGVTYNKFFFKFSFTIDGVVHVYYSEQFEFPFCETLTFLRGCYPNEEPGVEAIDCNGIYYGFPTNDDFLGNHNFRYIHTAFLRMASIIEQSNKLQFTAFNNKKTYKTVLNRERILEFELVPTFFKNILLGIFTRGNIQVDGTEWKLAETQDISIVDLDSKLWKMDMILDEECKQAFSCNPADCVLPVDPCCDPTFISASAEISGECVPLGWAEVPFPNAEVGVPYNHSFTVSGTTPFSIVAQTKPAWMTIGILGSILSFTGTPDAEGEDIEIHVELENCAEGENLNIDGLLTVENNFVEIEVRHTEDEGGLCAAVPFTAYLLAPDTDVATGVTVYASPDIGDPLIGGLFIDNSGGVIYNINSLTGVVGLPTGGSC